MIQRVRIIKIVAEKCKTFRVENEKDDSAFIGRLIGEVAMMLALSQVIIIEKNYETKHPNEK